MIKKLKRKFVTVTMLFMTVTFGILFTADSLYSRYWDEQETLNTLKWYADSDSFFEFDFNEEELTEAYGNPIFAIRLNSSLDIVNIKSSSTVNKNAPVTEDIHAIFAHGRDRHKWKSYLYIISEQPEGYLLIITDWTEAKDDIYRKLGTLLLIVIGFLILLAISFILSNFVTKPAQKALEREKQFISDASHELKTPLAAISINAQALQPLLSDNRHLRNILSETRRMDSLIQRLLKLSYLEEAGRHMEKQVFSLSQCCEEMVLSMESILFEQKIAFHYEIEDNIMYLGNEDAVKQIIAILLDNALKHTPELGTITFRLVLHDTVPVMTVENSGEGIAPEDLPHIFERFYRTDKSRQKESNSYGLGLAIAKTILDAHNADITVASDYGKGVCFTVHL